MLKQLLFVTTFAVLSFMGLQAEDAQIQDTNTTSTEKHLIVTEEKVILPGALSCDSSENQCTQMKCEETKLTSCKGCKKKKNKKVTVSACKDCG